MDDSSSGGIRLLLGLIAGALIGVSMGLGVDIVGTETAIMAAAVSVIVGFASTYLLKMGVPRRDKPSAMGIVALLVMLACYLVIGRLVLAPDNTACVAMYAIAGLILAWFFLTSVAEGSLLYAFGIGGLGGGILGLVVPIAFAASFSLLFNSFNNNPDEKTLVSLYLVLICTIPGAFAAAAGRMSGWGLVEHTKEDVWAFNSDGRLYVKQATR